LTEIETTSSAAFEPVVGWEKLPHGIVHRDVSDVAVDATDRVFLLTRKDPRVLVYDRSGDFISSWGEDVLSTKPHGITVAPDGAVWIADEGAHVVRRFTADGVCTRVLGTPGEASDTGFDPTAEELFDRIRNVRAGPPFNRPTAVAVAPDGETFVSDGYGNARVHRFGTDGTLLASFGAAGAEPGSFRTPHGICLDTDDRVLVADRGNERIQVFTRDGDFVDSWDAQRPNSVAVSADGTIYVGHSAWMEGNTSWVRGKITAFEPAFVSLHAPDGELLATIGGGPDPCRPGNFVTSHGIALDSHGDLYVADVTHASQWHSSLGDECHTFQKLARRDVH
jgi:DNA-binding beta-propeller fold protein YncE